MATIGTGLTITFASGFFAEILNGKWTGIEREPIDVTHSGSTVAREFLPSTLYDPGQLEVELQFVPGTTPPITNAAETVTVTHTDGGASTWAASGFLMSFEWEHETENKYTANATVKFTGALTVV